jgi:hypothetical protein
MAAAENNLGNLYSRGEGVEQDDNKAVMLYKRAAGKDFPLAQYNLANMYLEGRGVKKDDKKALKWFLKAAKHGHVQAARNAEKIMKDI